MAEPATPAQVTAALSAAGSKLKEALVLLQQARDIAKQLADRDDDKSRLARAGFKEVRHYDGSVLVKPMTMDELAARPVTVSQRQHDEVQGLYEEVYDIYSRLDGLVGAIDQPFADGG